jgi:hypothetical protein
MHRSPFYVIEQTALRYRFVFTSYSKFKKFEKCPLFRTLVLKGLKIRKSKQLRFTDIYNYLYEIVLYFLSRKIRENINMRANLDRCRNTTVIELISGFVYRISLVISI